MKDDLRQGFSRLVSVVGEEEARRIAAFAFGFAYAWFLLKIFNQGDRT
jgi:hypothetical protein